MYRLLVLKCLNSGTGPAFWCLSKQPSFTRVAHCCLKNRTFNIMRIILISVLTSKQRRATPPRVAHRCFEKRTLTLLTMLHTILMNVLTSNQRYATPGEWIPDAVTGFSYVPDRKSITFFLYGAFVMFEQNNCSLKYNFLFRIWIFDFNPSQVRDGGNITILLQGRHAVALEIEHCSLFTYYFDEHAYFKATVCTPSGVARRCSENLILTWVN